MSEGVGGIAVTALETGSGVKLGTDETEIERWTIVVFIFFVRGTYDPSGLQKLGKSCSVMVNLHRLLLIIIRND